MDFFSSLSLKRTTKSSKKSNLDIDSAHRLCDSAVSHHPFAVPDLDPDPDLRQRLSPMTSVWSNPTSRSNSSNSMSSPSAKSSASSADSFMSFPRLTPRLTPTPRGSTPRGSTSGSSSTRHFLTNNPWDQRSNTPLPKILPKLPECVIDYDQIIGGSLTQFIRFSNALGQDVMRQAQLVKSLFELQREFILISTGYEFNDSPESGRHFTNPLGSGPAQAAKMREIKIFAARHTYSPHAPHLQFVGDTIGALGWVVAGDKPIHFIRESYDGGKHHVKHIPGTHAESNSRNLSPNTLTNSQLKIHSGWVNIWQNIIIELDSYVREHHSKGFKWKKDS